MGKEAAEAGRDEAVESLVVVLTMVWEAEKS